MYVTATHQCTRVPSTSLLIHNMYILSPSIYFSISIDDPVLSYARTTGLVTHMAFDSFIPGNILYADVERLFSTSGRRTNSIVGQSFSLTLYREGIGNNAAFLTISGFYQLSESQVIVVDYGNECLRLVDRLTRRTSRWAGQCTRGGNRDGSSSTAQFQDPWGIIPDIINASKLIITSGNALRMVDISTQNVQTLVTSAALREPKGLVQEHDSGDIYVSIKYGVARYDYSARTVIRIAGGVNGASDGSLLSASFKRPKGIVFVPQENLLILADDYNNKLRVLNLNTNTTSSICTGQIGTKSKNLRRCRMELPCSLMLNRSTLYIGTWERIRIIEH